MVSKKDDTDNSDMPKRSHKIFLKKKLQILNLMKKKVVYRSWKNKSLIFKERNIGQCNCFASNNLS